MKNFLYSLLIRAAIMGGLLFGFYYWLSQNDNPGYVLMGFGHWSLESSLVVFTVGLSIAFFILYFCFRLLGFLVRQPKKRKQRRQNLQMDLSNKSLVAGLVDAAEGNWEKAEKTLIKHASSSGSPLVHYLTAAKAAQYRGAAQQRKDYLELAKQHGSEIAVGLTEAELHLSEQEFDEAVSSLTKLQSIDENHARVLTLLHKAYRHLENWEGIQKLLPALHKNKVLMEADLKLSETDMFIGLLKSTAERHNVTELEDLWQTVPVHIQTMQGVPAIYFAAMIEASAGAKIEKDLTVLLNNNFDDSALVLFGKIESNNPKKQLETAEDWQVAHPNNAILQRVLGEISLACHQTEQAVTYFTKSLAIEATVAVYQLLGDLLSEQGDAVKASQLYKKGLELASSEVVQHIETANFS